MATFNTEKDVKRKVKRLLESHGWMWWMPAANGFGKAGVADFNAFKNGVFLAVETKYGTRKPTANQIEFLQGINAQSGFGFVVNEKRLDVLEKWLDAFERSTAAASRDANPATEDGAMLIDCIAVMTAELD